MAKTRLLKKNSKIIPRRFNRISGVLVTKPSKHSLSWAGSHAFCQRKPLQSRRSRIPIHDCETTIGHRQWRIQFFGHSSPWLKFSVLHKLLKIRHFQDHFTGFKRTPRMVFGPADDTNAILEKLSLPAVLTVEPPGLAVVVGDDPYLEKPD